MSNVVTQLDIDLQSLLEETYTEHELTLVELGMAIIRAAAETGKSIPDIKEIKTRFMDPGDNISAENFDRGFAFQTTAQQIRTFADSRKDGAYVPASRRPGVPASRTLSEIAAELKCAPRSLVLCLNCDAVFSEESTPECPVCNPGNDDDIPSNTLWLNEIISGEQTTNAGLLT